MKSNFFRRVLVLASVLLLSAVTLTGYLGGSRSAFAGGTDDAFVKSTLNLKHTLRFNSNGKFKILIFSDIQDWNNMTSTDTLKYMNAMLDQEKPDLVLLAGDNHAGAKATQETMQAYLDVLASPMESRKIPWAQVYGNHVEGGYKFDNGFSKELQQKIFEAYPYNLSKAGTVYGVGNYVLPVLASGSDKIAFNVFMLDSHSYLENYIKGFEEEALVKRALYSGKTYDCIHFDQIKWYWDTSVALEKYNGAKIPAMMLFHIPLYEWNYIIHNKVQTGMTGSKGEDICAPEVASGLFQAVYERGDVKGIFCGHDHVNDFEGTYMGIKMAYCATIGNYEYCGQNRGARIIEIDENDAFNFTTRMLYTKDVKI